MYLAWLRQAIRHCSRLVRPWVLNKLANASGFDCGAQAAQKHNHSALATHKWTSTIEPRLVHVPLCEWAGTARMAHVRSCFPAYAADHIVVWWTCKVQQTNVSAFDLSLTARTPILIPEPDTGRMVHRAEICFSCVERLNNTVVFSKATAL